MQKQYYLIRNRKQERSKNVFLGVFMVILMLILMSFFIDAKPIIKQDAIQQMETEVNFYAQK
jgi:hypothetical protein